jgi:hypothetical protein
MMVKSQRAECAVRVKSQSNHKESKTKNSKSSSALRRILPSTQTRRYPHRCLKDHYLAHLLVCLVILSQKSWKTTKGDYIFKQRHGAFDTSKCTKQRVDKHALNRRLKHSLTIFNMQFLAAYRHARHLSPLSQLRKNRTFDARVRGELQNLPSRTDLLLNPTASSLSSSSSSSPSQSSSLASNEEAAVGRRFGLMETPSSPDSGFCLPIKLISYLLRL